MHFNRRVAKRAAQGQRPGEQIDGDRRCIPGIEYGQQYRQQNSTALQPHAAPHKSCESAAVIVTSTNSPTTSFLCGSYGGLTYTTPSISGASALERPTPPLRSIASISTRMVLPTLA